MRHNAECCVTFFKETQPYSNLGGLSQALDGARCLENGDIFAEKEVLKIHFNSLE